MAQYQIGVIYERTGKPEDCCEDFPRTCGQALRVHPRPLALLELANVLRQPNPKEPRRVPADQKEFPDSTISEQADRGWSAAEILAAWRLKDGAAHRKTYGIRPWPYRAGIRAVGVIRNRASVSQ